MKCHMKCGINAVCIHVLIASKTVFNFGNLRTKPPFWKRLPLNHNQFKKRAVTQNTSEHLVNNEQRAITAESWNWVQFKIYLLDPDSVWRIHGPVKMAAGHLPTGSHNFAWCGVNPHDRVTTLTLQNKYDPTLPSGYQKVAYPLKISFWIRNLFTR